MLTAYDLEFLNITQKSWNELLPSRKVRKLSEANIVEIYEMRKAGVSQRAIAKKLGVSHGLIGHICVGKRHLGIFLRYRAGLL